MVNIVDYLVNYEISSCTHAFYKFWTQAEALRKMSFLTWRHQMIFDFVPDPFKTLRFFTICWSLSWAPLEPDSDDQPGSTWIFNSSSHVFSSQMQLWKLWRRNLTSTPRHQQQQHQHQALQKRPSASLIFIQHWHQRGQKLNLLLPFQMVVKHEHSNFKAMFIDMEKHGKIVLQSMHLVVYSALAHARSADGFQKFETWSRFSIDSGFSNASNSLKTGICFAHSFTTCLSLLTVLFLRCCCAQSQNDEIMVTVPTQPVVQEDWVNDVKMVLAEKRSRIEGVTATYPSSSDGKHQYFSMNAMDRIRVGATLFRLEFREGIAGQWNIEAGILAAHDANACVCV